jgi:hypothetical protein
VVEHPIRKLLLAKLIPHVFLRVQFRRIGRQWQQADIVRDARFLALWELPSTTITRSSVGWAWLTSGGIPPSGWCSSRDTTANPTRPPAG